MLLQILLRFLCECYLPKTCVLESMFTLNLGHKSPRRKVHVVFKLVKVLRSVCTIPSQEGESSYKPKVQNSNILSVRPPTKKVSSLHSILTTSKLKFENVICYQGTFSNLHIETLGGNFCVKKI